LHFSRNAFANDKHGGSSAKKNRLRSATAHTHTHTHVLSRLLGLGIAHALVERVPRLDTQRVDADKAFGVARVLRCLSAASAL